MKGAFLMKKALIVIDMQNDFIAGSLGTAEAQAIVDGCAAEIKSYKKETGLPVMFTMDTHGENYAETQEGRKLPVPHCIKGSTGWELEDRIKALVEQGDMVVEKPSFGCADIAERVKALYGQIPDEITVMGLCTDICVVSNVMLLKAAFPEINIRLKENCCAGVTPESHRCAVEVMKMCQIEMI